MDLRYIEFMDQQVELWMQRKSEDSDTEVPSSVLKYFFRRSTDERDIETVVASHGRNPDQRCGACEVIKPKKCFKPNNECCLQCIARVARNKLVNTYF